MESIEEYIAKVSKENEIILDKKDPLCALHTILKQFEKDLLQAYLIAPLKQKTAYKDRFT